MQPYKIFFLVIVLNIMAMNSAHAQSINITNQADSASIIIGGKLVAKLFWPDNPIIGQNDIIDVSLNNNYLLPPSAGGSNYSLNQPVHFSLRTLSTINFDWGVYLRLYVDTAEFKVKDVISHTNIYKVFDNDTIFTKLNFSEPTHGSNYVQFEILSISSDENYLVVGFNFLFGVFMPSQLTDPFTKDVLVPKNKELILLEGVSINTSNYSRLIIKGVVNCNGTEINPINFNTVMPEIWGENDSNIENNILQFKCNYTNLIYINQYSSNSILNNCYFGNISVSNYSSSTILNCRLLGAGFNSSKGLIDNCQFDSSGFSGGGNSILEIKNSLVKKITGEASFTNCYVVLKNNIIYADAFTSAIEFINSLAIVEGNKLIYTDNDFYNDGFSVFGGSFAVLSKNIIKGGFRAAMRCGYGDTLVAYNNTIINNAHGFNISSTSNRMSFANNIFYMQVGWAINLDFNTITQGKNMTFVDSNLCYQGNPLVTNYINNPQDSSFVYGNINPIIKDPAFVDLDNCYLMNNSPAIDKGLKKIYSFGTQFTILDTTIIIPDSITISSYFGIAPDLGAVEYDPSVNINDPDNKLLVSDYSLSQNFPNPFNASSIIKYSIPTLSKVSIKIFSFLGEEIETLVDEEKSSGEYQVEFNGGELSSGVYFVRFQTNEYSQVRKMILLK